MANNSSISTLESRIRQYINAPRTLGQLSKDKKKWVQICSSLDAIGDAEIALDSFLSKSDVKDTGELYLLTYGVLQVLYVEQDAVQTLSLALGNDYTASHEIKDIRAIRIRSVGHPTRTNNNSSHFISRSSMSVRGFTLLSEWYDDRRFEFRQIDLHRLIAKQRAKLAEILDSLLLRLKEEELAHRRSFRDNMLAHAFHESIGYLFSKISEAAFDQHRYPIGKPHVEMILSIISEFEQGLEKRGLQETADHRMSEARYPLEQLLSYFSDSDNSRLVPRDIPIFADFAERAVNDLRKIAEELDDEYAAEPK